MCTWWPVHKSLKTFFSYTTEWNACLWRQRIIALLPVTIFCMCINRYRLIEQIEQWVSYEMQNNTKWHNYKLFKYNWKQMHQVMHRLAFLWVKTLWYLLCEHFPSNSCISVQTTCLWSQCMQSLAIKNSCWLNWYTARQPLVHSIKMPWDNLCFPLCDSYE